MITFVTAVHNCAEYLRHALDSMVLQKFTEWESVVVDDGSTDESLAIAREYASRHDRIRVLHHSNKGLADSLNIGIAQARGEWIARLDADDIASPLRLELQYAEIQRNARAGLIGSNGFLISKEGVSIGHWRYPEKHLGLVKNLEQAKRFFAHSSAVFSRKAFDAVGGYRPVFRRAQDLDLWLRLANKVELHCVQEPLVQIRQHGSQISHDEGGQEQVLFAYAARVTHWLRRAGHPDPLAASTSDAAAQMFIRWLQSELSARQCFEGVEYARELRSIARRILQCRGVAFSRLRRCVSRPQLFRKSVLNALVGERDSREVAAQWIVKSLATIH